MKHANFLFPSTNGIVKIPLLLDGKIPMKSLITFSDDKQAKVYEGEVYWQAPYVGELLLLPLGGHHRLLAATKEPIAASYRPLEPTRDANHDINSPVSCFTHPTSDFNPVETLDLPFPSSF